MRPYTPKKTVLLLGATAIAAALLVSASALAAGNTVTLERIDPSEQAQQNNQQKPKSNEGPTFSRKLWNGSFDRAADASGAAARQLEGVDYGDCNEYLKPTDKYPNGQQDLFQVCQSRAAASKAYAGQARSIQKQQNTMSIVSKAADVAAVGAVGAVIYGEMAVKKQNQVYTYDSAAHIERTAGQVSYVTGAADMTMGAYAYVAQKNKLEQMKNAIAGTKDGVKASSDPAVTSALTNAVEAAKKAAYSHMLWGAGKVAAGYGMMYLAKKSEDQAAKMQSIQDDLEMNRILQARAAAAGSQLAPPAPQTVGIGTVPYYQNGSAQFALPNAASGASGLAAHTGPVTYTIPGGGTGSSAPLTAAQSRALASAAVGKISGGGGGGGAAKGGEGEEPSKEKSEKAAKEAIGSSFETQLTGAGGLKPFAGGAPAAAGKEEIPNIAALMGNGAAPEAASAATGLSPALLMQAAREGTDGNEQGSMAGVNGKSEVSLFEITRAKLTKMFQVGNVGIPKNVEVK